MITVLLNNNYLFIYLYIECTLQVIECILIGMGMSYMGSGGYNSYMSNYSNSYSSPYSNMNNSPNINNRLNE